MTKKNRTNPPKEGVAQAKPRKAKATQTGLRLDLGCGKNKREGFTGVDSIPFEGVDVVLDLTGGEGANFQLEAAGVPSLTFPEMERSMAVNGKIAQVGRAADRVPVYLDQLQVRHAQFFGSQGHTGDEIFPNVIRLMASGALDNRKIITARFALDNVVEGIKQSGSRTDGKILVTPR